MVKNLISSKFDAKTLETVLKINTLKVKKTGSGSEPLTVEHFYISTKDIPNWKESKCKAILDWKLLNGVSQEVQPLYFTISPSRITFYFYNVSGTTFNTDFEMTYLTF